jgi:hypothetical protein
VAENCLEIENALKFKSLEACKDSLKNHQNSNFQFQERKMFRLFGVMKKTSVLSDKNEPLSQLPQVSF